MKSPVIDGWLVRSQRSSFKRNVFATIFLLIALLPGCTPQGTEVAHELSSFIAVLKNNGVDGSLELSVPNNSEMDYIATYVISAYTSTRIISFFKFNSEEQAQANLTEALKNPKFSGQTRNGAFLMAATFFPPDDEAVAKIQTLFEAHKFNSAPAY
ncbi:MAG: hypothetical protein H6965_07720 [Chromatiaceae bacterium]|nr:hypothetical protein [Chromatiaceae bacterium]